MKRDIDNYSKDKLSDAFSNVTGYSKTDTGYGVTKIQYKIMPGKHLHWFGLATFGLVNLGVGIAAGVKALGDNTVYYFDSDTGKLLGSDLDVARNKKAESLNKQADELFKQEKYAEAKIKYEEAKAVCPKSKTDVIEKYNANIAETEKLVTFKALIKEGVKECKEGKKEESEENNEEALDYYLLAEGSFNKASEIKTTKILLDYFVYLIVLYKNLEETEYAIRLAKSCKEKFHDEKAQLSLDKILKNIDKQTNDTWSEYAADMPVDYEVIDIDIQLLGSASAAE